MGWQFQVSFWGVGVSVRGGRVGVQGKDMRCAHKRGEDGVVGSAGSHEQMMKEWQGMPAAPKPNPHPQFHHPEKAAQHLPRRGQHMPQAAPLHPLAANKHTRRQQLCAAGGGVEHLVFIQQVAQLCATIGGGRRRGGRPAVAGQGCSVGFLLQLRLWLCLLWLLLRRGAVVACITTATAAAGTAVAAGATVTASTAAMAAAR